MDIMKNYIKEITARIQGDSATVIGTRNARKAQAAIKSQINSLESQIVDAEVVVEEKAEALQAARYPTVEITKPSAYLQEIANAKVDLEDAQSHLDSLKADLEAWSAEMGILFSED